MSFYLDRARQTRFGADGVEKKPDLEFRENYTQAMNKLFRQRPPPVPLTEAMVFDQSGNVRRDIFLSAYSKCAPTSTPGYPLCHYGATNAEVPLDVLYNTVNEMLKAWLTTDVSIINTISRQEAFRRGLIHPATVFVKSEPTGRDKVARLIFGVSLTMNVIARIFFHNYLKEVATTWRTASHKVGMDFVTNEGLYALWANFEILNDARIAFNNKDPEGDFSLFSNDIQGWEYQVRDWMVVTWHQIYMHVAQANSFHRKLQKWYYAAESAMFVVDSDGFCHGLPFYIGLSGRVTTHLENSDERGALADAGNGFYKYRAITNLTNGDDCIELRRYDHGKCIDFYAELGFKITDSDLITCDDETLEFTEVGFCSQKFGQYDDRSIYREPDGLGKAFYKACVANDDESLLDTYTHIAQHPAAPRFISLIEFLRFYSGNKRMQAELIEGEACRPE